MDLLLFVALGGLALAERSTALRFERSRLLRRGFATDLVYLATGALGLGLLIRGAAARIVDGRGALVPELAALPAPVATALALVLYDLGAYAVHLLLHRCGPLWRVHQVHHSSPTLDWLATFRAHAIEHALRHLASPALLLLAGFPLPCVAIAGLLYAAWAAFVHANLRAPLGALEPLLVTPRLHRLHHVPGTSASNLGTIFSVWDRLRGTLVVDPAAPLRPLGVPGRETGYPQTWPAQLVEPIRSAGGRTSAA